MAQRVTRHLRLLRQLKYLTASKTPMVSDYPRNFGNAAKDGLKGTTRWAVYYLTNPISWYPVLERAMILSAISAIQPLLPTSRGDSTEHIEDEELGVNICCSSGSPLCQTGNNGGNSLNSPFEPLSERNLAGRTGKPRTL